MMIVWMNANRTIFIKLQVELHIAFFLNRIVMVLL